MKTAEPHIQRARLEHYNALSSLSTTNADGLKLWRKLRRLEQTARRASTDWCNGKITAEDWERFNASEVLPAVRAIFGRIPPGFFINGDARGTALKLENPPAGLWRDMGGDGVLAAEII